MGLAHKQVCTTYCLILMRLRSEFHNRKLESVKKDPQGEFQIKKSFESNEQIWSKINNEDLMSHVSNNLPWEYGMILIGLENHIMSSCHSALTIEVICKK